MRKLTLIALTLVALGACATSQTKPVEAQTETEALPLESSTPAEAVPTEEAPAPSTEVTPTEAPVEGATEAKAETTTP